MVSCFIWKYNYVNFNKLLGVTFILSYVTSEYWEIPTFVCGHFGWFEKIYEGSINQLYLIVCFILLVKYSKFSFSKNSMLLLLVPLKVQ